MNVEAAIRDIRLIAILRLSDHRRVVQIAKILADNGVRVLEVTVEHPHGLRSVEQIATALAGSVVVGAGTVLDAATVGRARDAGARFCVSPHLDGEVVAAAQAAGLLPLPGALTPTEIVRALSLGISLVKLFPASVVGTGYLTALRGPLPGAALVPTGGIGLEDASRWLAAGAAAVAIGGQLVDRGGGVEGLAERAQRVVTATRRGAST